MAAVIRPSTVGRPHSLLSHSLSSFSWSRILLLFTKVRVDVDGGITAVGESGRERKRNQLQLGRTDGLTWRESHSRENKRLSNRCFLWLLILLSFSVEAFSLCRDGVGRTKKL